MKRAVIMILAAAALLWGIPCSAETQEEFMKLKGKAETPTAVFKGRAKLKVKSKSVIIENLKEDCEVTFHNENVVFEYGLPKIREESRPQLIEIAEALKQALNDPELSQIQTYYVDGHTCNIGSQDNNCTLSWARAAAAVDELVKLGVPRDRLMGRGFSFSVPTQSNDTEEGRQANRRVVVSGDCKKDSQLAHAVPCQPTGESRSSGSGQGAVQPEMLETVESDDPMESGISIEHGVRAGHPTSELSAEVMMDVKGLRKKPLPQGFRPMQPSPREPAPKPLPPGFKKAQ